MAGKKSWGHRRKIAEATEQWWSVSENRAARTAQLQAVADRKREDGSLWAKKTKYDLPTHGEYRERERRLFLKYGILLEEYEEMLRRQAGACAVCRRRPAGKARLAVDHDHATGKVRGLLCIGCNGALGTLEGNWDRLVEYLGVEVVRS